MTHRGGTLRLLNMLNKSLLGHQKKLDQLEFIALALKRFGLLTGVSQLKKKLESGQNV